MDAKTREALEASIRHWEENVAAEKPDQVLLGSSHCALCKMFRLALKRYFCDGCPVNEITQASCKGEPSKYKDAVKAWVSWDFYPYDTDLRDAWRVAAQAELDFLKSLRPQTEDNQEK